MFNKVHKSRIIVRLSSSRYFTNNNSKIVYTKTISVLKKRSGLCLGDVIPDIDVSDIQNINDVDDGVYELVTVDESYDWETGHIDDWELMLIPIKGEL